MFPAPATPRLQPRARTFTLAGVDVWRPDAPRLTGTELAVSGGRVIALGGEAGDAPPLHEYAGCVVTPGLVDAHLHLPADNALRLSGLFCLLLLTHGVTTVRDAGDGDGSAVPAARRGAQLEDFPAPRIVACGPFVARAPASWANSVLVTDADAPADLVHRARQRGAQTLKLYERLTAIARLETAAQQAGLPTMGHVPAGLAYEHAGVRHVQHFHGVPRPERLAADSLFDRLADWSSVDDARRREIVEATLAQGIRNTPTLVVTEGVLRAQDPASVDAEDAGLVPSLYPRVVWDRRHGLAAYRALSAGAVAKLRDSLDAKLELLAQLHAAGAELFPGTDVQQPYVVPGAALHRELRLWARAGLALEAIWQRATAAAGTELGLDGVGRIEVGAPADLLVFDRDPVADLDALGSLRAVVADGRLYDIGALRDAVDALREHYARPLVQRVSLRAARRAMRRVGGAVA